MTTEFVECPVAAGWRLRIQSGLDAFFKQPDGSSRQGVDWLIALERDGETLYARVRACIADEASRATRRDRDYQAATAMQYVCETIENGWDPHDSREHVIRIGDPLGDVAAAAPRDTPWWRFW